MGKHLRVRFLPRLFVLCLVIVTSLFLFPFAHAQASGPDCVLHFAPYNPPEAWITRAADQTIDLHWVSCATHDQEGPFTFEIWIAPINQLRLMQGWNEDAPHDWTVYTYSYPRPLISDSTLYTFWVKQCFWDGSCTDWSTPVSASFPGDLWWLHL